ncbi:hypothetical protein [Cellulomonas xiejunii]|uniref:Gram-positive cocci surface proteins LPxTG domain-containing protein n=1 Tax=Cellulomonas xiejunii TaxID=2968083 RepID=A0ABY5KMR2_9CELL|nr:hypothetical protein [Cellulomonas xiejunii]MCC2320777.1 hypothetical protein [Cellulomonas xiejunii]UUI71064.1 hypothetical protein NP048_14880 [Cellulomonas xiejunii]
MSARRTAALASATTTALTALLLVGAATAASAGSDAPPPYRVTGTALELPVGATLQVHGHVNVVYTSARGTASRNVHIEGPGTPFGDLVGTSVLTWDRAGLPPDACITWVQVSGYDEHYGEGGQAPVCRTGTPSAAPEPAPSDGAPALPPVAPAPIATAPAAPPVDAPAPAAPGEPIASAPTEVAPAPAEAPAAPAPAVPPAPAERAEVLAADAPTPAPSPTAAGAVVERSEVLAATGARTGAIVGGAALALAAGSALVLWRRRRMTP